MGLILLGSQRSLIGSVITSEQKKTMTKIVLLV